MGQYAMLKNTGGGNNTAIGDSALMNNDAGSYNAAIGFQTLFFNTTGNFNIAVGNLALSSNSSGSNNTAVGRNAGMNATTGDGNVYIGMGMQGVSGENNHTYIRNIKDTIVAGNGIDLVTVDLTTGLVGHPGSSRRYKQDINAMDNASETLYGLKPATFRFEREIDPKQALDDGLVAEEVAAVDPNLVIRNAKGEIENVRYNAVNAMLLNEFLKEHRKAEQQQATITELEKRFETMTAQQANQIRVLSDQIRQQALPLQHVSAQCELTRTAGQFAAQTQ